jgi:hypothetical protein
VARDERGEAARPIAFALATLGLLVALGIPVDGARGQPPPTLEILSPMDGDVIGNGTPVAVIFNVTNFNLTDPGPGPSSPDAGHVDVFVDGTWTTTASVNTVVLALPSGPHTIRLRLVMNNRSALNPDVNDTVSIVATRGRATGVPRISIPYPRDGAVLGTDFTVSFRITDFALVPAGGTAGAPNEGHLLVLLNGKPYGQSANYAPLRFSLRDEKYNVTLRLVDPAGHPLDPDVAASVNVTVRALAGRVLPFDATPYFGAANVLLGLAILAAIYSRLQVRR